MTPASRIFRAAACCFLLLAMPRIAGGAEEFEAVDNAAMVHDRIAPDVRSRALGGAVVAAPAGPADLWWNPAALPSGQELRVQYVPLEWTADSDLTTLALSAEWRNLRLGVMRSTFDMDPIPTPGPFSPGESDEDDDGPGARTWTFNAGADLTPWILPERSRYSLAAGVSARRLSNWIDETDLSTWDMDLGLIGTRLGGNRSSWWRLSTAAMVRNALGSEVTLGNLRSSVRRELRLGLACQAGRMPDSGSRQPLQVLLACGRVQNLDGHSEANGDHYGLEVTLFELLSPRAGYATRGFPRFWSWGGGLQLGDPGRFPVSLTVDYAREDWQELGGWQDHWAVALSGDFR